MNTPAPLNLAIIIGSVREGRFGPVVAKWFASQAREHWSGTVDLIDLADFPLPVQLPAASPKSSGASYPRPAEMRDLTERLTAADAFVIVTPEYNHSYPASLKAAIDWHFTQWEAKPVAFISYGSNAGGRHAVLHLENIFTELNAATIGRGLSFVNYPLAFTESGQPTDPAVANLATALLTQLQWWARALGAARAAEPFPG